MRLEGHSSRIDCEHSSEKQDGKRITQPLQASGEVYGRLRFRQTGATPLVTSPQPPKFPAAR